MPTNKLSSKDNESTKYIKAAIYRYLEVVL